MGCKPLNRGFPAKTAAGSRMSPYKIRLEDGLGFAAVAAAAPLIAIVRALGNCREAAESLSRNINGWHTPMVVETTGGVNG
jgi:hypothetical protein